jgi:ribosomal protein S18 acetylase RimI-like enzyme
MSFEKITVVKTGKELTKEELQRLADIDNTIPEKYDRFFLNNDEALKNRIEFFEKLSDQDFSRVIFDQGIIIAFHIIKRITKDCAYISTFWVAPEYRKSGLGRSLKNEGLKWAKESGFSYIQTGVSVSNDRMLSINRKNGYKDFSVIMRLEL